MDFVQPDAGYLSDTRRLYLFWEENRRT
jgi:hypothetical protein